MLGSMKTPATYSDIHAMNGTAEVRLISCRSLLSQRMARLLSEARASRPGEARRSASRLPTMLPSDTPARMTPTIAVQV